MKKTFKNLVLGLAVSFGLAVAVHAAAPVVWTATITNSLAANSVGVASTNALGNLVWSNGGSGGTAAQSLNYVDKMQAATVTAYASLAPTATAAAAANGTWTFNAIQSPDLVTWVPCTNGIVVTSVSSNGVAGAYAKLNASSFRYVNFTNVTCTVTNNFTTNSAIQLKLLIQ